jgi:PAS domain S-box-containing protein
VASTAARVYLCIGALAIVVYVTAGGVPELYDVFGISSAVAIAVGVRLNRPRHRAPWLGLALSQAVLGIGDFIYFSVYGGVPVYPSIADGFYLTGLVLFGGSIVLLVARTIDRRDLLSYVDAAVVALGVGLLAWALFFSGALGHGAPLARAVSTAYPLLELLLLWVLVRLLFVGSGRTASYYGLAGAVLLNIVSYGWYAVPALAGEYVAGTWRDAGWLASYIIVGATALHPSMAAFAGSRSVVMPVRRVGLLALSLVVVPLAALANGVAAGHINIYVFTTASLLMGVAVLVRVVALMLAVERTRGEAERARADAEQAERRFRMIFERAPMGISVGRDGMMSETNPALQRILGYSGEELARLHYTDITDPDEQWRELQHELDEGKRDRFAVDKRYLRKDGVRVEAHVQVALDLEDGLGISLIEDVTYRRGLEEQLRQAQRMEAIGKLAGGIAHDFNNLMTAVIGYSDLLLVQLDRDDHRQKVDAIRDSAVRASDLTRQLLAFGRRQLMQVEDIDVRRVVQRMDTLLSQLIGEDIRLETVFGSDDLIVRADRSQLEQVVMNLAVNARDAMPHGGTLTIAALSDGKSVILSVIDDGVGMNAETVARIYEPFFTTKPLGEGTGLGLSTVHGIVGQTGGTIDVESEPGAGTIFKIQLPLAHPTPTLPLLPVLAAGPA